MQNPILLGARLAFSEYPIIGGIIKYRRNIKEYVNDKFLLQLAKMADSETKKKVKSAEDDAIIVAESIFLKLIVVDRYGTAHRQNGFTYERWKRDIEPVVGSGKDAASICGTHGILRDTKLEDINLEWCPRCWPVVSETIKKYR